MQGLNIAVIKMEMYPTKSVKSGFYASTAHGTKTINMRVKRWFCKRKRALTASPKA